MQDRNETYREPDWTRIAHLFKIGIFASLLALIGGDMLLGWGTADLSLNGMERYFSRYADVSDVRIFWSAFLGMIGITLETMSFFGVYRVIASGSERYAHAYRAGLIGMLVFGPFLSCHMLRRHILSQHDIQDRSVQSDRRNTELCKILSGPCDSIVFHLLSADEYRSDNSFRKREDTVSEMVFCV